jgi:signal transduction histidine kinase
VSERTWRPRWRSSIFSKLLAIMLGMIVVLVSMVTAFFALVVFPSTLATSKRSGEQYARLLAASSPSLEAAKNIHRQADLDIRYEGPDGSWTTSESLPPIEQVRKGVTRSSFAHQYHVVTAPNGGTYLVVSDVHEEMRANHLKLLWMLLILIVLVVLVAYWFQKRLLRPVDSLNDGVARMSAGRLDVVLPVFTHDELGGLTDAFNKMVGRVKEMIQARDQLLLDVSHELRSPLTRMKVALALMPADQNRNSLESDVIEMEIMISEMLELERLRNPHGLSRQNQDLVPILCEVAQRFGRRSPGVRLSAHPEMILMKIDGERVRVVLRNLLENAFKYSLPDSQPVSVSATQNKEAVVIRVTDDGQGIPESQIAHVFEPFFRVDPSRSKKTGGYGLGLSISKRITEAHGGTITAENNRERGAVFILTFPVVA